MSFGLAAFWQYYFRVPIINTAAAMIAIMMTIITRNAPPLFGAALSPLSSGGGSLVVR